MTEHEFDHVTCYCRKCGLSQRIIDELRLECSRKLRNVKIKLLVRKRGMKVISNFYRKRVLIGTVVWDDEPAVQFPPFNERTCDDIDLEMKTLELIAIHRVQ